MPETFEEYMKRKLKGLTREVSLSQMHSVGASQCANPTCGKWTIGKHQLVKQTANGSVEFVCSEGCL
jgi:hypothetical protein